MIGSYYIPVGTTFVMETLGDLVARDRRTREPALWAPGVAYDYHQLCTTAQKTGNFFRHYGIGHGETVGIATSPGGPPILSLFGAALLGGRVRFEPPKSIDLRLLVAPADRIESYDLPPSAGRVSYAGESTDPTIDPFGAGVWSENPACPTPSELDPDDPVLSTDERAFTHATLLAAAESAIERWEITASDELTIRTPLSRPETVVVGILAPILVGATVVVPETSDDGTSEAVTPVTSENVTTGTAGAVTPETKDAVEPATIAIVKPGKSAPESTIVPIDEISLSMR